MPEVGVDQKYLLSLCEKIGKEVLEPNRDLTDRERKFPKENLLALSKYGINGITVAEEFGGLGLGYHDFAEVVGVLSKYCASTAMVYVMHMGAVEAVNAIGNQEQKKEFLLPIREEGRIGGLAFSEPGTGGHFWYSLSQAVRDGEDYIIDVDKSFVTSAGHADWYIVYTRTPEVERTDDLSYFMIYDQQEGVYTKGNWEALGLNGNSSGPMGFHDVRVPRSHLLGEEGTGSYWNDNVIDPVFLLGSSACWTGVARGALERSIQHVKNTIHKDFNRSLGDYQLIRHYLAQMQIAVAASEAMVEKLSGKIDDYRREERELESLLFDLWQTKVFASKTVIDVTNLAIQVTGGRGYKRGPIEQAYRDGRAGSIMGPTNEMCMEWVGKTLLDMPIKYWEE